MIKLLNELDTLTSTLEIFEQYDYHARNQSYIYKELMEKADRLVVKLLNNKEYQKLLTK